MQKPFALIAALSIVLPPVDGSAEQARKHPAKRYPTHFSHRPDYAPGYRWLPHSRPKPDGWFPRDASKLPIGTRKWFDQMLRENRRNPG
jgi:hypothetical protein